MEDTTHQKHLTKNNLIIHAH